MSDIMRSVVTLFLLALKRLYVDEAILLVGRH
jgi:hypothetical protein